MHFQQLPRIKKSSHERKERARTESNWRVSRKKERKEGSGTKKAIFNPFMRLSEEAERTAKWGQTAFRLGGESF